MKDLWLEVRLLVLTMKIKILNVKRCEGIRVLKSREQKRFSKGLERYSEVSRGWKTDFNSSTPQLSVWSGNFPRGLEIFFPNFDLFFRGFPIKNLTETQNDEDNGDDIPFFLKTLKNPWMIKKQIILLIPRTGLFTSFESLEFQWSTVFVNQLAQPKVSFVDI